MLRPLIAAQATLVPRVVEIRQLHADPLGIARIDALVASDELFVGADFRECAIVVVPRVTGGEASRFGRCGDGPEEFRDIAGVTLAGSNVLVIDHEGERIRRFSLDGRLQHVMQVAAMNTSREEVWEVHALSDNHLLLVTDFTPDLPLRARTNEYVRPYLRVLDLRDGQVKDSALFPGPGIADVLDNSTTYVSSCVSRAETSDSYAVFSVNMQYPEFVRFTLRGSDGSFTTPGERQVGSDLLESEWRGRVVTPPMPDLSRAACSRSGILVMQVKLTRGPASDPPSGRVSWISHVRAVLTHDGVTRIGSWDKDGRWSQLGRLVGAHGDSFMFVNNDNEMGPEIRLVTVAENR